jgi:hypothetical protein
MAGHVKMGFVRKFRSVTDGLFLKLPLPDVKPSSISGLSVMASVAFALVFRHSPAWAAALLAIIILLDWLDGLVAKKHGRCSEEGYMADVAADRISEGIIFVQAFNPWFILFAINCLLSYASFAKSRHVILPLRHLFFIYLVLVLFGVI